MIFTYKCDRVMPTDLEKKIIEKLFDENKGKVALKEGENIIFPTKKGVIFFSKKGNDIEILDFAFPNAIIDILD